MTEYSNIKVNPDTFKELRDAKPQGVTWDHYLRTEVLDDAP